MSILSGENFTSDCKNNIHMLNVMLYEWKIENILCQNKFL